MSEYNIGDIFCFDSEYVNRAKFCDENNLIIVEIEPDEDGRRFQIQSLPALTDAEIIDKLRDRREIECFSVINRGRAWYNRLTSEQEDELYDWYEQWLNITDAYTEGCDIENIIPTRPAWIDGEQEGYTAEQIAEMETELQEIKDWYNETYSPTILQTMIDYYKEDLVQLKKFEHDRRNGWIEWKYSEESEYSQMLRDIKEFNDTLMEKRSRAFEIECRLSIGSEDRFDMPQIESNTSWRYYNMYRIAPPKNCIVQDIDNYTLKIGDGETLYKDLPIYYQLQTTDETTENTTSQTNE